MEDYKQYLRKYWKMHKDSRPSNEHLHNWMVFCMTLRSMLDDDHFDRSEEYIVEEAREILGLKRGGKRALRSALRESHKIILERYDRITAG